MANLTVALVEHVEIRHISTHTIIYTAEQKRTFVDFLDLTLILTAWEFKKPFS
jgi:hypothetical protein